MDDLNPVQDYLAKAQDADRLANQVSDIVIKSYWKRLARRDRRLAIFVERDGEMSKARQIRGWIKSAQRLVDRINGVPFH